MKNILSFTQSRFLKDQIKKIFERLRSAYSCLIYGNIRKETIKIENIVFATPSKLCSWRAETLFKKEPSTIAWIDGFDPQDTFWDIGANVGIYSIYAAVRKDVKVFAFEPSPFNFYVLSKNIYLNNMSSRISPFCIAFTENTQTNYLNFTSINEGAAHTSFQNVLNEFGESFLPIYSQSTLGFSVDDFLNLFKVALPTHLKIDVDGAEKFVIAGAKETLSNPHLKSLLIEMNTNLTSDEKIIFDKIMSAGFSLEGSDHPDGDIRLSNYIFRRG